MAQSVKLSDGSYIDASAVYDTNAGKTQQEINDSIMQWKYAGTVTYDAPSGSSDILSLTLATLPTNASEVMLIVGLTTTYRTPCSMVVPTSYVGNALIRMPIDDTYTVNFNVYTSKVVLVQTISASAKTYRFYIYYR